MIARTADDGSEWVPVLYNVRIIPRAGPEIHLPEVTKVINPREDSTRDSLNAYIVFEGAHEKAVFYKREMSAYIMRIKT